MIETDRLILRPWQESDAEALPSGDNGEDGEGGSEYRTFPQPYATVMEAFGFLIEERTDDSIKKHLPMALSFRAANNYMEFEALLI